MKQKVEIDIPEGYRVVRYDTPKEGELFLASEGVWKARFDFSSVRHFIVEDIKPRRKVFECVSEKLRRADPGEYWEDCDGNLRFVRAVSTERVYKVWREVDE